jgi:hypothetical protein
MNGGGYNHAPAYRPGPVYHGPVNRPPVYHPNPTVVHPNHPVYHPNQPVVRPNQPVVHPNHPVYHPNQPVVRPNPTVVRPHGQFPGYRPTWTPYRANAWARPLRTFPAPIGWNFRGPVYCHHNYIATSWFYYGRSAWYSPGIGFVYTAPAVAGPITVVVEEYVYDAFSGTYSYVTMYYNAYWYGTGYAYYDVFGNLRYVN